MRRGFRGSDISCLLESVSSPLQNAQIAQHVEVWKWLEECTVPFHRPRADLRHCLAHLLPTNRDNCVRHQTHHLSHLQSKLRRSEVKLCAIAQCHALLKTLLLAAPNSIVAPVLIEGADGVRHGGKTLRTRSTVHRVHLIECDATCDSEFVADYEPVEFNLLILTEKCSKKAFDIEHIRTDFLVKIDDGRIVR